MVSYSSLDTSSYFSQSSDFRPPSAPTTQTTEPMSLQSRPGPHAAAGETQHLKELFNNHIGLTVADLFQHTHCHQPIELSCHPPTSHPSIIQASSDQRSLILAIQNQHTRSSPITNQDEPSPPSNNNQKNLTINTSLAFDTPHKSTPVYPHHLNHLGQSTPAETRPNQVPSGQVASKDPPSLTPPAPLATSLFSSSNSTSISPHSRPNYTSNEERVMSSAPSSFLSRSPQTDSSISSRHTEHSDHVTTPNPELASVSMAISRPQRPSDQRGGNTRASFESSHGGSRSSGTHDHQFTFSSAPSHPFQAFSDFNAIKHSQGALGIIPKLEPNTANSSPIEFGQKIFNDPRRASTNPNSPQLASVESAPSSAGGAPPVWSQSANMSYPVSGDAYSQSQPPCQMFFPSQPITSSHSLPTTDRGNSTANTDHTKSAELSPFALNHPVTSPSTAGWSGDEMNEKQPSSAVVSGNAPMPDNHHLFNFPPSHLPSQAFAPSVSVDHAFKFTERSIVSNSNSLGLLPSYSHPRASYMEKIPENLVVLGEPGSAAVGKLAPHPEESGHNAVEKRYRNNINSHIAALADLVPALQHLRSLPSAATSRRHSSQFIVSTSAIGKIPSGLVDGVKAATKLSKGNILSKSVDYMRHLLRRRTELEEDIQDLKDAIESRVEHGDDLIREWQQKVNAKSPERERQRMLEQSQGEEECDEDEDPHDSNGNKKTAGSQNGHNGPNPSKKRKVADLKINDTVKLRGGKGYGKGMRKNNISDIRCHHLNTANPESVMLGSEPLPPCSNPGSFAPGSLGGRQEPLNRMPHDLVDELDVLREPPSNYHHQFIAQQHNPHDYSHLQPSGFSSDFMGHPFAPAPPPELRSQQAINNPTRPLLAVFMGLSFAVGSGYNYHQTRRRSSNAQETWQSPDPSHSPESSASPSISSSLPQGFTCHGNTCPERTRGLQTNQMPHMSISQAGLNAMSIASIICTLMFILKPEFVLNFFSVGQLRPTRRRSKSKRSVLVPVTYNSIRSQDHGDDEEEEEEHENLCVGADGNPSVPVDSSSSLFRGDEDVKILMGCSRKPGRLQYHRLCIMTSGPNTWASLLSELFKETLRSAGILVWGDVIEKLVDLDCNHRQHGKRARIKKINTVLAWMRIAEIESSWPIGRSSFLKRLHTVLKLYNLHRTLDWQDRITREELDCGKISGVLALSLKSLLGETNRLSPFLWRKALEAHRRERLAMKSTKSIESILPASHFQLSAQRLAEESWLNEALSLEYEEVCELLAEKGKQYRLVSASVDEFGGSRGWSPLKQIVESRAELELIEIWSRIFVSMITKTCPVENNTPRDDGRIKGSEFGLDGGLAELPTRLEEAGAPYALQVSQGRRQVEQSIERICRLQLGRGSAVGRMARVTRGMWAMAFGKRELAVEVGHELKKDADESEEEIGCVGAYLELVLGSRLPHRKRVERALNSTLDKLAKMTIDWLLIRREYIILTLIKPPIQRNRIQETNDRKMMLKIKCVQLSRILDMAILESQHNRDLNARSTKQSDEAIQAGEAREFDLRTAIQECHRSVFAIENHNF